LLQIFSIIPIVRSLLALILLWPAAASADWQWDDPKPQGNPIYSAVDSLDDGISVVAVGLRGSVIRQSASGQWTYGGPIAGEPNFSAVCKAPLGLLATGPSAGLWRSVDKGATWAVLSDGVQGRWLLPLDGNLILCLGYSTTAYLSANGQDFDQVPVPVSLANRLAAASASGRIVVVGWDGVVGSTTNGRDWQVQELPGHPQLEMVAGGPVGFLAAGYDSSGVPIIYHSDDGIDWTKIENPSSFHGAMAVLASHDGFVVQDYSATERSGPLHRLIQGQWSLLDPSTFDFYVSASLPLAASTLLFDERGIVATMEKGKVLGVANPPAVASGYIYPPAFSAAAAGPLCVALDKNTAANELNRLAFTSDGATWNQPQQPPLQGATALFSTAQGVFAHTEGLAAGFYRSSDGAAWQLLSSTSEPESPQFAGEVVSFASNDDASAIVVLARTAATFGNDSSSQRLVYSGTGWSKDWDLLTDSTWQENQPPSSAFLESVQWDGSRFIMILYPGRIFTSTDGRKWAALPSLPSPDVAVTVASGNGVLVARAAQLEKDGSYARAAAKDPQILYVFSEGRWWPRRLGASRAPEYRQVIWAGTQFCALGRGEIFTSADGWSWFRQPSPAPMASLCWSGTRLFGFSESFAIVRRDTPIDSVEPVFDALIEPRIRQESAGASSYLIQIKGLSSQTSWQITGLPKWARADRTSGEGPGEVRLTIEANTSKAARGAILMVAGAPHLLSQEGTLAAETIHVDSAVRSIKIPFSGKWSSAVEGNAVLQGGSTGSAAPILSLSANNNLEPREIKVDLNGFVYVIRQNGRTPAVMRSGLYVGPLGFVSGALSPESLSVDQFESFEGELRLAVTTSLKGEEGSGVCSVSALWHNGSKLLKFRGVCQVLADGTVPDFELTSNGATARFTRCSITMLGDGGAIARGIMRAGGVDFVFCAGKNTYREGGTLPSSRAGLHTFVLDQTAAGPAVAGGSYLLGADGTARISAVLSGGAKATCSTFVWPGGDGRLFLPFSLTVSSARTFVGGFLVSPPVGEIFMDWGLEGYVDIKSPQEFLDDNNGNFSWDEGEMFTDTNGNGSWDNGVSNLIAHGGRYSPVSGLPWDQNNQAGMTVSAHDSSEPIFTASATIEFGPLVLSDFQPEGARCKLKFNSKNGTVSGSLALPGKEDLSLFGVVNQAYGLQGRMLGFATRGGFATFTITPP
jgi:hypothetical protein